MIAALVTLLDMTAERSRTACGQRPDYLRLGGGERWKPPLRGSRAQQVSDLQCRCRHSGRGADLQTIEGARCGLQAVRRHVRVDRRGGEAAVAKQRLDDPKVGTGLEQVRGE